MLYPFSTIAANAETLEHATRTHPRGMVGLFSIILPDPGTEGDPTAPTPYIPQPPTTPPQATQPLTPAQTQHRSNDPARAGSGPRPTPIDTSLGEDGEDSLYDGDSDGAATTASSYFHPEPARLGSETIMRIPLVRRRPGGGEGSISDDGSPLAAKRRQTGGSTGPVQ